MGDVLTDKIHEIYRTADHPFDRLWSWADSGEDLPARHRRFQALCDWAQFKRDNDRDGDSRETWDNRRAIYCHKARRLARRMHDDGFRLADVKVTLAEGDPHWYGAADLFHQFIEPFMEKRDLPLGSWKRTPAENDATGGSKTSEHLTTMLRAAARDFPTFSGEDDARALAHALGFYGWQPNSYIRFNLQVDGHAFSVQILWGSAIGHGDHVHVGAHIV